MATDYGLRDDYPDSDHDGLRAVLARRAELEHRDHRSGRILREARRTLHVAFEQAEPDSIARGPDPAFWGQVDHLSCARTLWASVGVER